MSLSGGLFPWEFFFLEPEIHPTVEEVRPTEKNLLNDLSMELDLDKSLCQRERFLALKGSSYFVTMEIAMESLKVAFHQDPPMLKGDNSALFATRKSKTKVLWPLMEDWLSRGNLTKRHIPASVFFSLLFYMSKQNVKLRPILDQTQFNTDVVMPPIVMETLNEILKFVNQVM